MQNPRKCQLREIMLLAWDLYRTDLRGPDPRTFADALAGAWRWTKNQAERLAAQPRWATSTGNRSVSFGSMLQSPIRRALTGKAYAYTLSREAGRLTSRMGA